MKNLIIINILLLCFSLGICETKTKERKSYNILLAVPVASRSLHHLFSSLGKALLDQGHSVTLLTSFNASVLHPNLIHLQPGDFSGPLRHDNYFEPFTIRKLMTWIKESLSQIVHIFWTNQDVIKLYEERNKFDAIIYPSYGNEIIMPFLEEFRGISILFCTPGIEYRTISRYGNWLSFSSVPLMIVHYDEYMNFWERTNNFLSFLTFEAFGHFDLKPRLMADMKTYFPDFREPERYYENSSLTLINGHFVLDSPTPLLPNQVEVGMINARNPKPLPKDLEDFIQGSGEAGVIYFSLGSFILGQEMPKYIKDILVEAFRRVPQRVVWKYEENDLDLPPNVMTRKWLPQQDILGHPKTRIFMSHCGNLGTQEAKYHGVPVLAVPIAFDQPRNAARLVRKKYGVLVNWSEITVENLVEAIQTLTKDLTYYNRLKNLSRILKDQKDSPAERAVWWVEYVIRHKGAPHLRYSGQRLNFFQYHMVDVLAFLFAILLASLGFVIFVIKKICGCFKPAKKKKD